MVEVGIIIGVVVALVAGAYAFWVSIMRDLMGLRGSSKRKRRK
jgi:hypothetical protein